jgi:hypothetical protein
LTDRHLVFRANRNHADGPLHFSVRLSNAWIYLPSAELPGQTQRYLSRSKIAGGI